MFHFLWRVAAIAAVLLVLVPTPPLLADEADKRLPIPDEVDQRRVRKLVGEIFAEEYKQAKTPAQKLALSAKLFKAGVETNSDAAGRFVLLQVARKTAVQAGDATAALKAVNETARSFQIDRLAVIVDVMVALERAVTTAAQRLALAKAAQSLIEEAIAEDSFDAARRLATTGAAAARRAKDVALAKRLNNRGKQIETLRRDYASVRDALEVLSKTPDDARANSTVGRYRCFSKGDWEGGLPMLARGGDPQLKILAEQDMADPTSPEARVSLADGWWSLAAKHNGIVKDRLQARAGHWYRLALAELKGLKKVKAQKRLKALADAGVQDPGTGRRRPRKDATAARIRGADKDGSGWRRHGVLPTHRGGVRCVAFSPDSRLMASNDDRVVRLSDPKKGLLRGTLTGHLGRVTDLSFSADGAMLATASDDGTARLWDMKNGRTIRSFNYHTRPIVSISLSPDGTTLATAGETVRLCDVSSGKQTYVYDFPSAGGGTYTRRLAISPTGKLLAVAVRAPSGGTSINLLSLGETRPLKRIQGFDTIAFSPNGKVLATGGCGKNLQTVKLYDMSNFQELAELTGHTGKVHCAAWYPTGKMLATGGEDQTIRLWSTVTMKLLATLEGHTGNVQCLAFSPDGTMLASGSADKTVIIWEYKSRR